MLEFVSVGQGEDDEEAVELGRETWDVRVEIVDVGSKRSKWGDDDCCERTDEEVEAEAVGPRQGGGEEVVRSVVGEDEGVAQGSGG